jgi:hypothetical protein
VRVVALGQAEGGCAQNRVWQGGRAKKRAVGCSNGSTRREKRVAGRAGMRAQALEMCDRVLCLLAER